MTDFESQFEAELASVPEAHRDPETFVPGHGPSDADVMLVGEAPGETEVKEGEPFVGQAGSLLDSTLEKLGIDRESLYLTNVVKVRRENNETPRVAAIDAWLPVLEAEIEFVDPDVVVTLGTTASQAILDTDDPMKSMHGQRFERYGRIVVPTYHPAAFFYDESKREVFEADLESALSET